MRLACKRRECRHRLHGCARRAFLAGRAPTRSRRRDIFRQRRADRLNGERANKLGYHPLFNKGRKANMAVTGIVIHDRQPLGVPRLPKPFDQSMDQLHGAPEPPKPPIMTVAPSGISAIASVRLGTVLSIGTPPRRASALFGRPRVSARRINKASVRGLSQNRPQISDGAEGLRPLRTEPLCCRIRAWPSRRVRACDASRRESPCHRHLCTRRRGPRG